MNSKSDKRQYIILAVIMLMAGLFVFFLLFNMKENAKAKPLTTTTRKGENTSLKTTKEPVIATNFGAPLSTILKDMVFSGDYEVKFKYSGAEFNFNCTKYDESKEDCVEGSALMNAGTAVVPLYTYKSELENYYYHKDNMYIIVIDSNIIIVTYNSDGVGEAKILDRSGKYVDTVKGLIFSYKIDGKDYPNLYPSITDDNLYYYSCEKGKAAISGFDLKKNKSLGVDEVLDGTSCK